MKERLEAALKYEQAMILYEEGKISYQEIYALWLVHSKFIMEDIYQEALKKFLEQHKIGLT